MSMTRVTGSRRRARNREVEAHLKRAEAGGWRFREGGHAYFGYCPCGEHQHSVNGTPSDGRALKNSISQLQRCPGWMGPKEKQKR